MKLLPAASALSALLLPTVAAASPDLETVLVTGSYVPLPELTASASVVDAAQIAALNKRTVAAVLQTLPGILVEEQGGPGGLTAVSIRGGEANFTLVLLDGVPVNDPTNTRGGGFDFANLSATLVDRIEVVRGAQSAVYGSDALAGVINIVTRRPAEGHTQSLLAEAGEDDYRVYGLSAAGNTGEFEYSFDAVHRDDGDPTPGSERETDSINLRLGWQPAEGHTLSAGYRFLEGDRTSYPEQSGGPAFAVTDDLDQSDFEDHLFSIGWQFAVSEAWLSELRASRYDRDESYDSPGIPPFLEVPPNGADTQYTRDDLRWVNTLTPVQWLSLSLGIDYREEDGDSTGYVEFFGDRNPTDFALQRDTTGLFASASGRPLETLLLQGSVRRDDPDGFDTETSWQAGFRWTLPGSVTLSANRGEAFKLPSFFALGNALVGNPDLEPETAESWDAGLAWEPMPALRLEGTWFFNDFKDLVDFDDETFRNVNRSNIESSGVELWMTWTPLPALDLQAQATYTDLDLKGEDTVLTGRPEWTAGAVASWRFAPGWESVLDYRYGGEQFSTARYTGQAVTEELDDYHRVDWVLSWRFTAGWQLQLAADNLTDEDYDTAVGFAAPGRALRLGLRFTR